MKLDALLDFARGAGRRFVLGSLLPVTLAIVTVAALLAAGAPQHHPSPTTFINTINKLNAGSGLALALLALTAALLLTPLQLPLVRLLEGYWPNTMPLGAWKNRRRDAYARRRKADEETTAPRQAPPDDVAESARIATAAWRLLHVHPADDTRTMPTRLGNVLRTAEDQAGGRYGLDTVTFWPRLYPLLSDQLREVVDDARDQLDLTTQYCATLAITAAATATLLIAHGGWWLLLPVGLSLASTVAYRASVTAALVYAQALNTAFDLHRFALRQSLHLPLPPDLATEIKWNRELTAFLAQGFDTSLSYEHSPS